MSGVMGFIVCKQCNYPFADYFLDTRDQSSRSTCSRCGHYTKCGPVFDKDTKRYVLDSDGDEVWETVDEKGFGAFCYREKGSCAFVSGPVELDRFDEIKKVMEENLKKGVFLQEPFYLSRWNDETQQVEVILGQFPLGEGMHCAWLPDDDAPAPSTSQEPKPERHS